MSIYIGKPRCDHSSLGKGGSCPGCNYMVREARANCTKCDGDIPCVMHRPAGWVDWREERKKADERWAEWEKEKERKSLHAYLASMGWREAA